MASDPTSLSSLHDVVLPPTVPWWPLAPGWIFLISIGLIVSGWLALRSYNTWKLNAYRRAALRELSSTQNPAAIAELLRRAALATAPRSEISSLTGKAWPDWLNERTSISMTSEVRYFLESDVYKPVSRDFPYNELKAYAIRWITTHQRPETDSMQSS